MPATMYWKIACCKCAAVPAKDALMIPLEEVNEDLVGAPPLPPNWVWLPATRVERNPAFAEEVAARTEAVWFAESQVQGEGPEAEESRAFVAGMTERQLGDVPEPEFVTRTLPGVLCPNCAKLLQGTLMLPDWASVEEG